MATLTTKTDDAGKPISYKFTCCVGRDDNGKQIWRTKTIKSPGLTPKREKDYVADKMAEWEKQQKADYARTHNAVDKDKSLWRFLSQSIGGRIMSWMAVTHRAAFPFTST